MFSRAQLANMSEERRQKEAELVALKAEGAALRAEMGSSLREVVKKLRLSELAAISTRQTGGRAGGRQHHGRIVGVLHRSVGGGADATKGGADATRGACIPEGGRRRQPWLYQGAAATAFPASGGGRGSPRQSDDKGFEGGGSSDGPRSPRRE